MLVALAGVIYTALRKPRRAAVAGEPGCGQCGYSTRGLTTLICPECGSDFRRVGIATTHPVDSGYVVFIVCALFFTLFLYLAGNMIEAFLRPLLPMPASYS